MIHESTPQPRGKNTVKRNSKRDSSRKSSKFRRLFTPVAGLNLPLEKVSDSSNFSKNSLFSNSVLLCSFLWVVEWIHK